MGRELGVRKIWHELRRQQVDVARCMVERLMRALGIRVVVHGKVVKTMVSDRVQPCPQDLVNMHFNASRPNALWMSDFT